MKIALIVAVTVLISAITAGGLTWIVRTSGASQTNGGWGTDYDVLLSRSDVEVEYFTSEDGWEVRKLTSPGPVIINERRRGEEYEVTSLDRSGLGAVRCAWEIYATLEYLARRCEATFEPRFVLALRDSVDQIEDFMRENSMTPVSDEQFKTFRESWEQQQEKWYPHSEDEDICKYDPLLHMAYQFSAKGEAKFRDSIDELLSVPRLPVMNPCI